ncbi:uncharacterized protein LOC114180729 [Vigna unguiculata]|uniref:uncharacterized protein LOC114180729 n=1 Tax=Vigna unguiculata TaxID=3917 RepID=UPI001015D324|nr:uncharacterized protein LOC114180729 [Vigna unguiculata]
MGYNTTYRKAWLAKQQAIEDVYGNWEQSYNRLSCLLQAMQTYLPEFVYKLKTSPITNGEEVVENQQHFRRVFWTFKPCIDGFPFCKPIVQVDGTFLYGRYRGTLLVAVAQDGRNNIFPIAFAIVEGETVEACAAFNRPNSSWTEGNCVQVFCIRHIAQNFTKRFKNTTLKKDLVNMAYALTEPRCNYYYNIIREDNPEPAT